MDTVAVYSTLLSKLAESPMWTWDAAPSLWALLREEEPVVVTPIVSLPTTGHLLAVARAWREQIEGAIPVDQLCLITEGWEVQGDERREVRDLVAIAKDGDTTFLRYYRDTSEIVEVDSFASSDVSLDAAREVGAAAWQ